MVGCSCGQFKQGDPRFGGLVSSGGRAAACDGRKRRITRVAAERVRPRHRVRPVVARRDGCHARERPMAHRPVRAAAYPVRRCGRWSRRPSKPRSGGRALRMRVGGLVRHRVARMHAQAHAGRRRHARAHTQAHPHRTTQTHARTQHECKRACTPTHQRVHTSVDCEALLGNSSASLVETGRRCRAVRTRGRAADSCSCWFASRLHLVCDALDVARNRPLRARMWRVRRPAHVLAHVCATACTID